MAPNTEQLILQELKGIREELTEQGKKIASLEGTLTSERRFCSDCKTAINKDLDTLYKKTGDLEVKAATAAGKESGQDKGEKGNNEKITIIIAILACAGAWAAVFVK